MNGTKTINKTWAIFLLACLNVCIGLISCCGTYFAGELPRVSYRGCALVFAAFSCAAANLGLDAILDLSATLLSAMYPVAIVLVALGMARRLADRSPRVWRWTVAVAAVVSVADAARSALGLPPGPLPLAGLGLGWVCPTLVAALLALLLPSSVRRELS